MQLLKKVGHHVFQIQCIFGIKLKRRNYSKTETLAKTRNTFCGTICPIAKSTMNELFLLIMHYACTKRPYFHFRS